MTVTTDRKWIFASTAGNANGTRIAPRGSDTATSTALTMRRPIVRPTLSTAMNAALRPSSPLALAEQTLWQTVTRLVPLQPTFFSVTYGAGGSTRVRTHATVKRILAETKLTPAAHLTCVAATTAWVRELTPSAFSTANCMRLRSTKPCTAFATPAPPATSAVNTLPWWLRPPFHGGCQSTFGPRPNSPQHQTMVLFHPHTTECLLHSMRLCLPCHQRQYAYALRRSCKTKVGLQIETL